MKNHYAPKWESAEDLSRRAALGDTAALVRLSKLAEQAENDDQIEMYVDGFDNAAMLYAMGADDQKPWHEFRQIIRFFERRNDTNARLYELRGREARLHFEMSVLEEAISSADRKSVDYFQKELETSKSTLQWIQSDINDTESDARNTETMYTIAKKKLSHPRFTSLPDNILDELIETVGYELDEFENKDDHESGAYDEDEESEDVDGFLSDDCEICKGLKKISGDS